MFSMRLKLGTTGNNEWRACFCLHVRISTIAFGIWHLFLHILALTVLAAMMRNHSYFEQKHELEETDFLPTPLSKVKDDDNPYYLPTTQDGRPILPSDMDMGAIMTICTFSITLLMVYGAIKGKPKQILPFFFLQLFDFAITTLTATGYFCYLRSVHRLVSEHWHNLPFRQEILSLSPQNLSLLVLLSFLISMIWKAYWIGVVWRCYKFLTLQQQATNSTIHYILPNEGSERNDPDYAAMFRDNEAALFGPLKQTPPPSYQDVMDEQPPPYPAAVTATTTVVQEIPVRRFLFTYAPDDARDGQNEESTVSTTEEATTSSNETNPESPVASCSGLNSNASPKKEQENHEEAVSDEMKSTEEVVYIEIINSEEVEEKSDKPVNV
ncbi:lysosomal-associated transmembrane protein 4B [Anthonomus grandis grandis]|uniref:lysosomal-associated transmembrane protein 4B n=1 Tax=Anthonomus grandis grandis TaxID=2921223 RepID=UPI0021652530|nr:lysosomal-associated transmembrane protein 4B [Anthonomus grandis grandis]XP_050298283.1 lysosomal-associated transmembrane protein 4B [Anthonomus grandis grandis]XP_050298284.1 lysosomal-associated transmembrane protein 4B [Anthonomus grandis grandis]